MNNSTHLKLSIEAALQHPDWDAVTVEELDLSTDLIEATVLRFQGLCGLHGDSDPALLAAASHDVLFDGALFIKLNEGISQFLLYFFADDLGIYSMTDAMGSEDWAIDVCGRAQVVESVGDCLGGMN